MRVDPSVLVSLISQYLLHRPPDNDRYVRTAPDNPKKASFLRHWFILFSPISQTRFQYDGKLEIPVFHLRCGLISSRWYVSILIHVLRGICDLKWTSVFNILDGAFRTMSWQCICTLDVVDDASENRLVCMPGTPIHSDVLLLTVSVWMLFNEI